MVEINKSEAPKSNNQQISDGTEVENTEFELSSFSYSPEELAPDSLRQSLGSVGISGSTVDELLSHADKIEDPGRRVAAHLGLSLIAGKWPSSYHEQGLNSVRSYLEELNVAEIPTTRAKKFMTKLLGKEIPIDLTQTQIEEFVMGLMTVYPKLVKINSTTDPSEQVLLHIRGKKDREIVEELRMYTGDTAVAMQRFCIVRNFHERGYSTERIQQLLMTFLDRK